MRRRWHELSPLANLYPTDGKEELEYLYQSVGHDAIEKVSCQIAGLPLYRHPIRRHPQEFGLRLRSNC